MPRTRQNRRNPLIQDTLTVLIEDRLIVSRFLTQSYWELAKLANKDITCPVCLESWLGCKHCATMMTCGHALHSSCLLAMNEPICPVCRNGSLDQDD